MDSNTRQRLLVLYDSRSRSGLRVYQQQYAFAMVIENACLLNLDSDGKNEQLAQALVMQGRYEEAITRATYQSTIDYANSLIAARDRENTESCDCTTETIGANGQTISPLALVDHVWSTVHNDFVYHYYCALCGDRNITPELLDA